MPKAQNLGSRNVRIEFDARNNVTIHGPIEQVWPALDRLRAQTTGGTTSSSTQSQPQQQPRRKMSAAARAKISAAAKARAQQQKKGKTMAAGHTS